VTLINTALETLSCLLYYNSFKRRRYLQWRSYEGRGAGGNIDASSLGDPVQGAAK